MKEGWLPKNLTGQLRHWRRRRRSERVRECGEASKSCRIYGCGQAHRARMYESRTREARSSRWLLSRLPYELHGTTPTATGTFAFAGSWIQILKLQRI
ncbi:hypothetical protein PF005_g26967 [Phytophthora fragariae]|nr:hypothetical protein PF009_g27591 [Phytophthora fragariae]KAE9069780.1 hypothetical protein PF010_g26539 [Phytophthora fragariae]KAE9070320.1 hypothetical protein PF007_g26983 [Phytophthora fragariae]KAE9171864.1 hypothetical protein PF005_g26967 [Phytophthora fragariae]KAE9207818.1 hypothetical protein PF002_g19601 [Phytophthora fragariae]